MIKKNLNESRRPWLAHYPDNRPSEIDALRHQNLAHYILDLFHDYADLPAFTNYGVTKQFRDIEHHSKAFAAYLQQKLGYQKGERVALMMPNLIQYPVCFYGCILAGIEVVNVNPLYTARELEYQLKDAKIRGIVITENFAHTLAEIRTQIPSLQDIILTQFGDELGWLKGPATDLVVKYFKKKIPYYSLPDTINYRNVIKEGRKYVYQEVEIRADEVAMLQYTGGTTGVAKGAMLTHANILANIAQIDTWIGDEVQEQSLVLITALPLYHIFCCTVNCLLFPGKAMHSILITDPRDMKSFVKILSKYPFAVMTGVNTLFKGLLRERAFRRLDFSHLRFVIAGGMPVDEQVSRQWQQVTGNVLIEGYGLTETSPVVCVNWIYNDGYTHHIGFPLPSTEVKLCDDEGNEVGVNQPGEMWVRGPQVMKGYWQQPHESSQILTHDGWLKTGDIAKMDEYGHFKIIDRKKDMILVSGFNVYPNEVEKVLSSHPSIHEAGCASVPSEDTGEAVKAYIVLENGKNVTIEELQKFTRKHLTGYKRPKFYQFCEALPKSNVGKVLRRKLSNLDDK